MGWGDRFVSHHFETIHWYCVSCLLKKTFPMLNKKRYILFCTITCNLLLITFRQSVENTSEAMDVSHGNLSSTATNVCAPITESNNPAEKVCSH